MIYELKATLYFTNKARSHAARLYLESLKSQVVTVNPGQKNAQISIVELIQNHHSTIPPKPCVLLSKTELS